MTEPPNPFKWQGPIDSGPDSGTYYWHLVLFSGLRLVLRNLKSRPEYFWGNVYRGAVPLQEGVAIEATTTAEAARELIQKARRISSGKEVQAG